MNFLAIGYSDGFIFSRPICGDPDIDQYPQSVAQFLTAESNYTVDEWDQILLVDFDENDQVPRVLRHWNAHDFLE